MDQELLNFTNNNNYRAPKSQNPEADSTQNLQPVGQNICDHSDLIFNDPEVWDGSDKIEELEKEPTKVKQMFGDLLNVHTDTILRHFTEVFVFEVYQYIFTDPTTKKLNPELDTAFLGTLKLQHLGQLPKKLCFEWSEGEKHRHAEMTSWLNDKDGKHISEVVSTLRKKVATSVHPDASKYLSADGKKQDITVDMVCELVKEKYGVAEKKWLDYGSIYKQVTLMKDWLKKQNIMKLHQV